MCQKLLEKEVGEGNGAGLAMLGIGDVVGGIATDEHVIGIDALGQMNCSSATSGLKWHTQHVPRPCSVASIII